MRPVPGMLAFGTTTDFTHGRYDLVAFLLCLGIVAFAVSTRPKYKFDDWPVHHAVFAAQVVPH